MNEELISKKELLDITGISYGQLYRWKRKKLIPEEWFIKKSSFTGQETFFPKAKILERVKKIVNLKDEAPLDEIAQVFSPNVENENANILVDEIVNNNILSKVSLNILKEDEKEICFKDLLYLYIADKFIIDGSATKDEEEEILDFLKKYYEKSTTKQCDVYLVRKFGVSMYFLLTAETSLILEDSAKLIMKVNIQKCNEELKLKIYKGKEDK